MDLGKIARDPWVWGQLYLLFKIAVTVPVAAHVLPDGPWSPWLDPAALGWRVPGMLLGVAAVALLVWGFRSLGPNLTPATEPLPNATLVETGIYRYVRHPIYLAVILLCAAYGWGIANPFVGLLSGIIAWLFFDRKAAAEEKKLIRRFPAYGDYRRRVPRLVPRGALRG
jgi:protein-S-isoprenylcysteine O-methyltransferase Ste14